MRLQAFAATFPVWHDQGSNHGRGLLAHHEDTNSMGAAIATANGHYRGMRFRIIGQQHVRLERTLTPIPDRASQPARDAQALRRGPLVRSVGA